MTRFLLGCVTGLILSAVMLIVSVVVFPPETAAPTPAPQIKAEVSASVRKPSSKTPSLRAVTEAHAAFNLMMVKAVSPALSAPEVTDAQAVESANFAEAMRQKTGAVPDADAPGASSLVDLSYTPTPASYGMRAAKEGYFEVWDDLMQRCYMVVAEQKPLDETGLTPHGKDRVSYSTPETRQTWFAADKAFKIRVKTRRGETASGVLRTCVLESNRFALVDKTAVGQLKGRFHDWWARERLVQATVEQEYPYKLSDQHRWYGGLTRFGSAQGCPIKVEFSEITIGRETDATLFLTESDRKGCAAAPGSGARGKVRVNRLPQASD